MNISKKETSYLEEIKEYQDKMNLPGYYTGGKINPMFRSKTKAGALWIIMGASFMLLPLIFQFFSTNTTYENPALKLFGVLYILGLIILSLIAARNIFKASRKK